MDKVKVYNKIKIDNDKRVFFVGDLHGEYDKLQNKLKLINFNDQNDILISVGDLIDRGPKITHCLFDFLTKDNYFLCLGNHEIDMIYACEHTNSDFILWSYDYGGQTSKQLGESGCKFMCKLLKNKAPIILELEYKDNKIGIIHGGFNHLDWNDIKNFTENDITDLFWNRSIIEYYIKPMVDNNLIRFKNNLIKKNKKDILFLNNKDLPLIKNIDFLIHGHTPVNGIISNGQRFWIDTQYSIMNDISILSFDGSNWKFY